MLQITALLGNLDCKRTAKPQAAKDFIAFYEMRPRDNSQTQTEEGLQIQSEMLSQRRPRDSVADVHSASINTVP